MAECPSCGSPLEAGWQFCQACGRAISEESTAEVPDYVDASGHRLPRRRLRALLAAVAVLLLGGLALAVNEEVQTHRDLSDTRDALAGTRSRLSDIRSKLATTAASLKRTRADLKRRTTERNNARTGLASAQQQLDGVRQSLSDSERQVDVQAGQIQTLRTCLDGIIDALVFSAEGNIDAAIGALDAVETACIEAEALL